MSSIFSHQITIQCSTSISFSNKTRNPNLLPPPDHFPISYYHSHRRCRHRRRCRANLVCSIEPSPFLGCSLPLLGKPCRSSHMCHRWLISSAICVALCVKWINKDYFGFLLFDFYIVLWIGIHMVVVGRCRATIANAFR